MLDDVPPAREPEEGLKVSQGWVLVADQLRVVNAVPLFVITRDWDEIVDTPEMREKVRVEVGTERTAWFETVTVIGEEKALLP
jgi:hypothetical protein